MFVARENLVLVFTFHFKKDRDWTHRTNYASLNYIKHEFNYFMHSGAFYQSMTLCLRYYYR